MQFTPATAALIISFAASALGHSAVSLAVGDVGGSMTGIGFDKSVPLTADNKNTIEVTANTMPRGGLGVTTDGLGTLNGKKAITMDMMSKAVTDGGPGPMPQVKKEISITYRQMVVDGQFDPANGATVLIDPTATGTFSSGTVAAKIGEVPAAINMKKAVGSGTIVGQEAVFKVTVPDEVKCTGPGNTCLVRVYNGRNTGVQRWGGHFCFQQEADGSVAPNATLTPDAAGNAAGAAKTVRDLHDLVERLNTYADVVDEE